MVDRTTLLDEDIEKVVKRGVQAWQRLKKDQTWSAWIEVGEALVALRQEAMDRAGIPQGTNEPPKGGHFGTVMGELLEQYNLSEIDKGDRSRLLKIMDNRAVIEPWYLSLPMSKRLRINHPSTVLRKWEAEGKVSDERDNKKLTALQKTEQALQLQIEINEKLQQENDTLKERIQKLQEELEWSKNSTKKTKKVR